MKIYVMGNIKVQACTVKVDGIYRNHWSEIDLIKNSNVKSFETDGVVCVKPIKDY
jgi:hypothetical protein